MLIILADAEREYVCALIEELSTRIPDIPFQGCSAEDEWLEIEWSAKDQKSPSHWLCLFNPVDFPDLPQRLKWKNFAIHCTFWAMLPGQPDPSAAAAAGNSRQVYRLGPVSQLAGILNDWVEAARVRKAEAECDKPCASHVTDPGGQDPDQPLDSLRLVTTGLSAETHVAPQNMPRIFMQLCLEPSGYRPEISRLRLRELVLGGCRVIYLPLMPTYQMHCLSLPGQGPSLSDLLFRLLVQDLSPAHLHQYLQPHPDGYLQFRPPDRSDDLVLCNPDTLRKLIMLLRQSVCQVEDPYTVLVDCAGIPLAHVASIAVLCDSCEICLPGRECYATTAACKEASYLLALLPPSCLVKKNLPASLWPQQIPVRADATP